MSSFGDAFKSARAAGKKTFRFNGKLYNTQTKEEAAKASPASPRPAPRPGVVPTKSERPNPAPLKVQGPPQNTETNIRKGLAAQGKRVSVLGRALDRLKVNRTKQKAARDAAQARYLKSK